MFIKVVKILEKHDPLRSSGASLSLAVGVSAFRTHGPRHGTIPLDEASTVQNYVEHMLLLLMEEESGVGGAMGPILEFVIMENVMERLFVWSLRRDFTEQSKLEQLKMYEMLIGQAKQPLLHHKPVLKPLMMLLSSCSGTATGQTGEAHHCAFYLFIVFCFVFFQAFIPTIFSSCLFLLWSFCYSFPCFLVSLCHCFFFLSFVHLTLFIAFCDAEDLCNYTILVCVTLFQLHFKHLIRSVRTCFYSNSSFT